MTIQPARHECHACYPLQAEKPGIHHVVGNTHGTHVEQVVSSFQKILRGSQLTWYKEEHRYCKLLVDNMCDECESRQKEVGKLQLATVYGVILLKFQSTLTRLSFA